MGVDKLTVTCSTHGCGNKLEINLIEQYHFPDSLKGIHDFLEHGVNGICCRNCKKTTIVPRISVFKLTQLRQFLVYLPENVIKDIDELKAQINSISPNNVYVEYFEDEDEFKHKVISLIFKTVQPAFSEFTTLIRESDKNKFVKWLGDNTEKLDKSFFSVCYLIQEKVIPFLVLIVPNEADLEKLDMMQMARAFYMVFTIIDPNAKTDYHKVKIENETREVIFDQITNAIIFRIILWAGETEKSKNIGKISEAITNTLPVNLITRDLINDIAKISIGHDEVDEIKPFFTYCLEAIIAALSLYSGIDNPNQERWTDTYLAFEYQKLSKPDDAFFQNNGVTTEFGRKTVKPERVWDHFANWLNQAKHLATQRDIEAKIWGQIVEGLGLGEMFYDLQPRSLRMDGEIWSEKIIDAHLRIMLEHGENSKPTIRGYLYNLANKGVDNLLAVSKRLRDGLFDNEKYDLGIWIVCRLSEILNLRMLANTSLQQLENCFLILEKLNIWPPSDKYTYRDFLTEQGNCYRYVKNYQAALRNYDLWNNLSKVDLQEHDYRTNERNRAIVFREMMLIDKSLEILNKLLPFAETYKEKSSILTSKAVCYSLLGQKEMAIQFTLDALKVLPDGKLADTDRLNPLINLAALSFDYDPELSYNAASQVFEIALDQNDIWRQTLAAGILARVAGESGVSNWKQINDTAINLIGEIINSENFESGGKDFQINLLTLLAERLEANGDIQGAEQILLELLDGYSKEMAGDYYWKVFANLSSYAFQQGKHAFAKEYLQKAKLEAINLAASIKAETDPLEIMEDKVYLQRRLAQLLVSEYPQITTDEDLRSIADFQSSIVLSSRIVEKDGFNPSVLTDNSVYSAEGLKDLLLASGLTTLAQIIASIEGVYILFTNNQNGKIVSRLTKLRIDYRDIRGIISEVSFRFSMTKLDEIEDPLSKLEKWQEFSNSLIQAFDEFVPKNTHVCVFPGILSGLPLHYPVCEKYSITYSPSLLTVFFLRTRRSKMPLGKRWRPMNLYDFVVWRQGESQVSINNFIVSSGHLERDLKSQNINYFSSKGEQGNQDILIKALHESESIKLSCHGRARIDNLKFELLLAANGRLPPQDSVALDAEGDTFFLNWDELVMLRKASPFVFSTACASGMAVSMAGGERIGIERYLLGAGTLSYVAPHWPVPINHVQNMMNRIIVSYISDRELQLHQIVYNEIVSSIENGVPPWVAKSISILGDWL